jgi:hypothetical protein
MLNVRRKIIALFLAILILLVVNIKLLYPSQDVWEESLKFLDYLPEGALLFSYSKDFAGLIKMFDKSRLKAKNEKSESFQRFQRSKLYLKIDKKLDDIDNSFSIGLNEAFVRSASDKDALLAIYDIGELKFMLISKIDMNMFEKTKLNSMKDKFETRKSGRHQFYFIEDKKNNLTLMFVWFDDTLLLSNDLTVFESSLDLFDKKDDDEKNILSNTKLKALLGNKKLKIVGADAIVYLDFSLINKTPYFKNYFLFNEKKDYLNYDKVLISAFFGGDTYIERRVALPVDGVEFPIESEGLLTSYEEADDEYNSDHSTSMILKGETERQDFLKKNVIALFFSDFYSKAAVKNNSAQSRANAVSKKIYDYLKDKEPKEGAAYFSLDILDDGFLALNKKCTVLRCSKSVDSTVISGHIKEYVSSLFLKDVPIELKEQDGISYIEMPVFSELNLSFYCADEYLYLSNDKDHLIRIKDNLNTKKMLANNPDKVIKMNFGECADDFKKLNSIITRDHRTIDTDSRKFFTKNVNDLLDSVDYIDTVKYVKKPCLDHLYEELSFKYK